MEALYEKFENLKKYLLDLKKVSVAFSGGVDSTFLLKTASEVLGQNVIAVTASSALFPNEEISFINRFCDENKIKKVVFNFEPLKISGFAENPKNRCYICKRELFSQIIEISQKENFNVILEGTNIDDLNDYRPGLKALEELKIISPLKEFGFAKNEIRTLLKEQNIEIFKKPSSACLASRFAYSEKITEEKIFAVSCAEEFLHSLGFEQTRLRVHGNFARIEVEQNKIEELAKIKSQVYKKIYELGFDFVTLDLNGYKTGAMNR